METLRKIPQREVVHEDCPLGICDGNGEVSCSEAVYPGEAPLADIGTQKCECQMREEEFEDDR